MLTHLFVCCSKMLTFYSASDSYVLELAPLGVKCSIRHGVATAVTVSCMLVVPFISSNLYSTKNLLIFVLPDFRLQPSHVYGWSDSLFIGFSA